MNFDTLDYRYPSIRNLTYGRKGMVCASQPLAAQAGLDVLKKGGNAVDAILAAASCLTVMEPNSNSLGGDCFAIIWKDGKLYGLNGSGPAPKLLHADKIKEAGFDEIPEKGWLPVTVPGVPGSWAAMNKRFGRLSLREDLDAAITYAKEGYPVSPVIAKSWQEGCEKLLPLKDKKEIKEWFRVFTKNGEPPKAGQIWKLPDHAKSLETIANTYAEDYYRGEIASQIEDWSIKTGGLIRKSDLEAYEPIWVDPVSVNYKGYDIWEIPPNGHGIVALMALNIMEQVSIEGHDTIDTVHKQIEAMKLAFADGLSYIADPEYMNVPVKDMLSKEYAKTRAALIKEEANIAAPGNPFSGGTVYLCAADESGMMVSFIQSGYDDFGSGVVIPGTGINLQDRGCNFSLDPNSPNYMEGGKRPYHTIIPGFMTKDGEAVGPFGVMGAFMQPQGHLQVAMDMIDFAMNPQQALNAPRWQWRSGNRIDVEPGYGEDIINGLKSRGHEVYVPEHLRGMGRGQIIIRDENGVMCGATEPRADGCVAAW